MGLFDKFRKKKIDKEPKAEENKRINSSAVGNSPVYDKFSKCTPANRKNLLQHVTECLPCIVNALRKDGWNLSAGKDKLNVYRLDAHGEINPLDFYICDSNGFYENQERAYEVRVASLGGLEKNFVGLYCYLNNDNARYYTSEEIADDINQISDKTSIDEVYQIYSKYMDISYLNANLNLDPACEVNGAFNLSVDGEWLAVNYNLGNYYIGITEVNRNDALYRYLLPCLLLKKKFAEEVALMIPSVYLDEKSFLEFYCLYSRRGFLYATEKE